MNCPAILIATDPACQRSLANLTVLDRLALAAHQAGAGAIVVMHDDAPPPMTRCRELEIEIEFSVHPPRIIQPTLLIAGNLTVQAVDLRSVMAEGGRLCAVDKSPLPCGIAGEWKGDLEASLPVKPRVIAGDATHWVKDDLTAAQAEDALWDTMGREADSPVDRHFNRPLGRPLSRLLAHAPISPNAVTIAATVVGLIAAWCFARGEPQWMILGAIVLQCAAVLDCVDGELARIAHRESNAGKWLDFGGSQLAHLGLFAGLGVGLHQLQGQSGPGLWLGLAGVLGMVIAFLIRLRVRQSPGQFARLQLLIDRIANRDFTLLLLVLAMVHRMEWFLWAGVIGVHCFWLVALRLQLKGRSAAAGEPA